MVTLGDCDYRFEGLGVPAYHRCNQELTHDGPHRCICGATFEPTTKLEIGSQP